jgi:hypothetical protein
MPTETAFIVKAVWQQCSACDCSIRGFVKQGLRDLFTPTAASCHPRPQPGLQGQLCGRPPSLFACRTNPFQHNRVSHLHALLPRFCIDVLTGKNWAASEAAHEARVAAELGLRPGMKVLDCGCGVGGPMRTIASTSGAHVTGNLNTLLTVAHVTCCEHKTTG